MSILRAQRGDYSGRGDNCFQCLADGAPVMIWMSGLDMGCFYFNRAWLDFRGRTLEQEWGNGWAEGVHPDDLEGCVKHYMLCFEKRTPFAMTYRLLNWQGEYRWILDRGAPHYLPDGGFLGFVGGCAETEGQAASVRNAQLRTSLRDVKEFARQIAEEAILQKIEMAPEAGARLKLSSEEMRQRMRHARSQLERLTADMLALGHLGAGTRVP